MERNSNSKIAISFTKIEGSAIFDNHMHGRVIFRHIVKLKNINYSVVYNSLANFVFSFGGMYHLSKLAIGRWSIMGNFWSM